MNSSVPPSQKLRDEFIKYIEWQERKSPRTVTRYKEIIERFLTKHPNTKNLNRESIQLYMRSCSQYATSTQAQISSAIKKFFKWGFENAHFKSDLSNHVTRPKVTQKLIHVLEEEDTRFLATQIKKLNVEEQILFYLLYGCGLRIAEAHNLCWKNIDLQKNILHIQGKGKRLRVLPLPEKLVRLFDGLKAPGMKAPQSIWPEQSSIRSKRRWVESWDRFLNHSGHKLHPHKLRHSIASHLLRRGCDLAQIQKFLGHQKLATTEKYTHINPDDLVAAYDKALSKKKK